jgi:DNA adenine methylase
VQIEREDWRKIFTRYGGRRTLFYVDPPYLPETRTGGKYEHEMDEGDHRELVTRILASRSMVVLSGYAHATYKPLESAGWKRVDIDVPAYSSDKRTRRTECLWLSPTVVACSGNGRKVITPEEKMRAGAHHTHDVRVGQTTKQIVRAIERLRKSGKEPTKSAVATIVGISREHMSRRYRHLFGA